MRPLQEFPSELLSIIASSLEPADVRLLRTLCRACCAAAWPQFKEQFHSRKLSLDSQRLGKLLQLSQHRQIAAQVQLLILSAGKFEDEQNKQQTISDFRSRVTLFNVANSFKALVNVHWVHTSMNKNNQAGNDQWRAILTKTSQYNHYPHETIVAAAYFDIIQKAIRMSQMSIETLDMSCYVGSSAAIHQELLDRYGSDEEHVPPPLKVLDLTLIIDPNHTHESSVTTREYWELHRRRLTNFFRNFISSEELALHVDTPKTTHGADAEIILLQAVLEHCKFRRLIIITNAFPFSLSCLLDILKANKGGLEYLRIKWLEISQEEYGDAIRLFRYLRYDKLDTLDTSLVFCDTAVSFDDEHEVDACGLSKKRVLDRAISYFEKRIELTNA